jgi:antitoxin MazE
MRARVQKWGNSLAVRIPKSYAVEAGLDNETDVELSLDDGKLVMTPYARPKFTLKQLMAQITDENLHNEVDTGSAVGHEIW